MAAVNAASNARALCGCAVACTAWSVSSGRRSAVHVTPGEAEARLYSSAAAVPDEAAVPAWYF